MSALMRNQLGFMKSRRLLIHSTNQVCSKSQSNSGCTPGLLKSPLSNRWKLIGGSSVEDGFVRLTSTNTFQKGLLYYSEVSVIECMCLTAFQPLQSENWELTMNLRIGGGGKIGGEGLAFFYTETPGYTVCL